MIVVSVIIPTFNRAHVLSRAIDSVLIQREVKFELIVVDDGSTDETSDLLGQYPSIKVLKCKNLGVSAARNLAIRESVGKYIAFLDSDDEWKPKKLIREVEFLNSHPEFPLVHTEEIWIRKGVRVNQKLKHQKSGGDIFVRSLELCLISPSSVMLRRELFDEVGLFNEEMIVCEDYDLWLRITKEHEVGFINEPLIVKYGGHEDQLSAKYFAMDYYRVKSMFSLFKNGDIKDHVKLVAMKDEILKKGKILLSGYEKHNNMQSHQEIFEIMKAVEVSR